MNPETTVSISTLQQFLLSNAAKMDSLCIAWGGTYLIFWRTRASPIETNASVSSGGNNCFESMELRPHSPNPLDAATRDQLAWDPIPGKTLFLTLKNSFEYYVDRPLFGKIDAAGSSIAWTTYREAWKEAAEVSCGLAVLLDRKPAARIGLLSKNRAEWCLMDIGCTMRGWTSVPLPATLDTESLKYILSHAQVDAVFVSSELFARIDEVASCCPDLRIVVLMDSSAAERPSGSSQCVLTDWQSLKQLGTDEPGPSIHDESTSIFTIAYTSGSTGRPKGAVNSYARWNKFVSDMYLMPKPLVRLSFMSIAHVTERQQFWLTVVNGGMMTFSNDMSKIFDEFKLVQPTVLSAAPRFYDQIYSQFKAAVEVAKENNPTADIDDLKEEVSNEFRTVLGSRMQYCIIGGAASSPEIRDFIYNYLKIPVYDGYGTSEAGGIASNESLYPGVEVKLVDCPEMGYCSTDRPFPRGEIVVRTPTMIQGYFKDEEATSDNFIDGWFRTGDIGEQLPDGRLRLIDRKKSLFKLVQGVFVAPTGIENKLLKSPFVDQIYVYGDTKRSNLVAIVVPNEPALRKWWSDSNKPQVDDLRQFYDNPQVVHKVIAELAATGRSFKLPAYEIPAAVWLEDTPFTSNNGLLTPSDKLIRSSCERRYKPKIEDLYARMSFDPESKQSADSLFEGFHKDADLKWLQKIGTDSLSTVKLASMIKSKTGVDVSLASLQNAAADSNGILSADSLAKVIEKATSSQESVSIMRLAVDDSEMQLHTRMLRSTQTPETATLGAFSSWKRVLLTGATGFLGFELLLHLLEMTAVEVVCAIRPAESTTGIARLSSIADSRNALDRFQKHQQRISIVSADLTSGSPTLGIPGQTWNDLCWNIDAVFHCGAIVNWILGYESIREANVVATKSLMDFCMTFRAKPFFYISTISTSLINQMEGQMMPQSFLSSTSAYAASKWAAEKLVRRASYQGLPAFIFKPGMITGHSQTGSCNPTDFVSRFIRGVLHMRSYFETSAGIEFLPVDLVARSIVALSTQHCSPSMAIEATETKTTTTFHFANRSVLSYPVVAHAALQSANLPESKLSYDRWQAILEADPENPLWALLPYFPRGQFNMGMIPPDSQWTNATLERLSIAFPKPSVQLVQLYTQYLLKHK